MGLAAVDGGRGMHCSMLAVDWALPRASPAHAGAVARARERLLLHVRFGTGDRTTHIRLAALESVGLPYTSNYNAMQLQVILSGTRKQS